MLNFVKQVLSNVFYLFYPNVCVVCGRSLTGNESVICLGCEAELPATNHFYEANNFLAKRFWGRVKLEGAGALYFFRKHEPVQYMVHQLKYKRRQDVGVLLGRKIGFALMEPHAVMGGFDIIVPVPLHWKKLRTRGYNQCDSVAKGIGEVMNLPWKTEAIERRVENISQTKKKKYDRYGNVADIFAVKDAAALAGKHVLLVDDVVTTGATAETCIGALLQVPGTRVSFVAVGMAGR